MSRTSPSILDGFIRLEESNHMFYNLICILGMYFFLREDDNFIDATFLQKNPGNKGNYKEVLLSSSIAGDQDERETRRCLCSSTRQG